MTKNLDVNYNLIRSELSHAYLQAVTAHLGAGCNRVTTPTDNMGIDVKVDFCGNWSTNPDAFRRVPVSIQLKSTSTNYTVIKDKIGYSLKVEQYNKYIERCSEPDFFLILLMVLPEEKDYQTWLELTPDQLIMKKCMYWNTLKGASPENTNLDKTIYFPQKNLFTPESLRNIILPVFAEGNNFTYEY